MRVGGLIALLYGGCVLLAVPVVSASAAASSVSTQTTHAHAVGAVAETFVDTGRPTAANGSSPARPSRTLVTTILYPATGSSGATPVPGATPDTSGGPYPLIAFSHGLGGAPADYMKLLESWAAAGFVVAAPLFPLSSSQTPGGPDGGDVINQPADVSFVISSVLQASEDRTGVLAGLVDGHEVGSAGHSNGAITTLGLVANTCCFDPRVRAAVVMAGTTEGYPTGHYDFTKAPPLLLVHDTQDELIPYRSAITVFNQAVGPKGLLTVEGFPGGASAGLGAAHMASSGVAGPASSSVIRATTDFFDAYLRGDRGALSRVAIDGRTSHTTIHVDWTTGSPAMLPLPAVPVVHLHAAVAPNRGLMNAETVTVRWSGYTAGKVVNILECSHVNLASTDSNGCDFSNAAILHPDPTGHGSVDMRIVVGAVGNGRCDAAHSCSIVVNNASSTDPSNSRVLPITFAP